VPNGVSKRAHRLPETGFRGCLRRIGVARWGTNLGGAEGERQRQELLPDEVSPSARIGLRHLMLGWTSRRDECECALARGSQV
jgi:hypothetical protein